MPHHETAAAVHLRTSSTPKITLRRRGQARTKVELHRLLLWLDVAAHEVLAAVHAHGLVVHHSAAHGALLQRLHQPARAEYALDTVCTSHA